MTNYYWPGRIVGTKYLDEDADGKLDYGEDGLKGWTIQLWKVDEWGNKVGDKPIATTTTDYRGDYAFNYVSPGKYLIEEVQKDGYYSDVTSHVVNVYPLKTTGTNSYGDKKDNTTDFFNYQKAHIEGEKYYDADRDGYHDYGEKGIEGWKIYLYSVDEWGNKSEYPVASTETDQYGKYKFSDLKPGTYVVEEEMREGWDSKAPTYFQVGLESGEVYGDGYGENTDFLNYKKPGKIIGTKYEDKDGDGGYDYGEKGIANWKISLFAVVIDEYGSVMKDEKGEPVLKYVAHTYTDEYGDYKFEDVEPGKYVLVEETKYDEGYGTAGGTTRWVTVEPDETVGSSTMYGDPYDHSTDFYNYKKGHIEGSKYYDADRDGYRDEYEKGVSGWKISLFQVVEKEYGEPELVYITSTHTDGYGVYKFDHLVPGHYRVVEEDLKGWDSNEYAPTSYDVTVESGDEISGKDFFNYKLKACIDVEKLVSVDGGKTWLDADCKTGPAADYCHKIQYKIIVTNSGEVDLYNVKVTDEALDYYNHIGDLGVGESEEYYLSDYWHYGQQTNVAKATGEAYYGIPGSSEYGMDGEAENGQTMKPVGDDYYIKAVHDEDAANYYGIKGVCTANYWKSKVGKLAWDGKANPKKYFLPEKDLLQDTNGDYKADGLRIGDFNFNGQEDEYEHTLVFSKKAALKALCTKKKDGAAAIQKELVAAWLNMLNGNSYDDGDYQLDSCEPAYWIDQAIKYLDECGPKSSTKAASWTMGLDTDKNGSYDDGCDVKSGYEILQVLKQYNKDGSIPCEDHSKPEDNCGCDDYDAIAQSYLTNSVT